MRRTPLNALLCALLLGAITLPAARADAFCGFYVSGGGAELFNDATQVALLRDGTKTVLSMQNNYKGPAKAFAMVVPVPVVLAQDDVKTLDREVFKRLDTYSAPRLVEYWEKDPCYKPPRDWFTVSSGDDAISTAGGSFNNTVDDYPEPAVTVEAEFSVGEYEVVILSATEASGLETWLKDNQYNIPEGAAPIFKSYIQQGMYFFVAKIDPAKVTYKDGEAVLSPLRFSYTSEEFSLPIRLGLVNSQGKQDLIITILADGKRYEAANYPNVTIPTNIEVDATARGGFGQVYTRLFDETIAKNPGAVVTEYAWGSHGPNGPGAFSTGGPKCDPCPPEQPRGLDMQDIATLGGDLLVEEDTRELFGRRWTFTRLHMRYDDKGLDEDVVFQAAAPIVGGREVYVATKRLEKGSSTRESYNAFQARYIIRNRWEGAVSCSDPEFDVWQGPNDGSQGGQAPSVASGPNQGGTLTPPEDSPLATRPLPELIREDVPELGLVTSNPPPLRTGGCGCTTLHGGALPGGALALLVCAGALGWRRRQV